MRTSKSSLFLAICFLYLCCFVQQCHLFAFITLSNMMSNAVASAIMMSSSMGINVIQSGLQGIMGMIGHGFMTIHTMTTSLVSGFIMGNLALAGFILFLLAIVPAEEEERRSLAGGNPFFNPPVIPYHNLSDYRGVPLLLARAPINSTLLVRNKRSAYLVNNNSTNNENFTINTTATTSPGEKYNLPESLVKELNSTERIPRFLTRLVQRDPLNCLPLLLCGLSASRKPSERTETLNDYAYLLKEFLKPESAESAEYDEEQDDEDDGRKKNKNRLRGSLPMDLLNQLVQGGFQDKNKDEVDKLIDAMRKKEDEELEDLALADMAEDPNDLRFALEDMKVRGLAKTVTKLPTDSRKKYFSKLRGDELFEEEEEDELVPDEEDEDPLIQKALMGRYDPPPPQYKDGSSSMEDHRPPPPYYDHEDGPYPPMYYDPRDLTRGAFPPPPPTPPTPEYGGSDEELYKRNLAALEKNLDHEVPRGFRRRILQIPMGRPHHHPHYPPPGMPGPGHPQMGNGRRRYRREAKHTSQQRAYLQKKRGEAAEADNIFDKSRVAAEVGVATRNNRQCRALFNECPVNAIARPVAQAAADTVGGAPFLNRAVNNIRRVLLGTSPGGESSKTKRVNEIKEAIQQLHPPSNHGGSEVKVVLNIGPSPQPQVYDLHRSGGIPAGAPVPQYTPYHVGPPTNGMSPPMMYQQHNMPPSSMNPHNMGMMAPSKMPPPPSSSKSPPSPSPTGFSTNIKYAISKPTSATLTTKRPQGTPTKPMPGTTKKPMAYHKPASSPASKKPLPPMTTQESVNFDDLAEILKTTMPPNEEEGSTIFPYFDQTTMKFHTFSNIVASMEQDEPSVEDDLVLPTRYPMSKEQYANNLRETFNVFEKFKEAHKTPVVVTIARATAKPKTTTAPNTGTRKSAPPKKNKGSKKGNKKPPPKRKPGEEKGEQADIEVKDGEGQDDLGSILKWFQKLNMNSKRKKADKKAKKGKGKKKKEESSEESSEEEEYHDRHALVAVPPPHLRQKVHWREGTTILKDGVYHLLFGKRRTKPLPPLPVHHHAGSGSDEDDDHHGKKPIRHDVHYYDHPHHDLPQHDHSFNDHSEGDRPLHDHAPKERPQNDRPPPEAPRPTVYHRLRTSESVEEEIPPPPPILQDEEDGGRINADQPGTSGSSSASEPFSFSRQKGDKHRPTQFKLKEPRPIPRPDPEPSSYEDDNEPEHDYGRLHQAPMPPIRFQNYDSRSIENSYEEEVDDHPDDPASFEVAPTAPPKMVFSPFSIVRNGNKMKLKSKGGLTHNGKTNIVSKKKKKKNGNKVNTGRGNNKGRSGIDGNSKEKSDLKRRTYGNNKEKSDGKNGHSATKTSMNATKPTIMTKVKAMSTTTIKPKRKVLKYKNG